MNMLLYPGVRLLDRLRLGTKFLLILLVFTLPLAGLVTFDVMKEREAMHKAQRERLGLAYLAALRPLFERMAQTRGMTNAYLQGDTGFADRIAARRRQLETDLEQLLEVAGAFGGPPALEEQARRIAADWQALQASAFGREADEVFAAHTAIIEDVLSLMRNVVERSGLLVDPELDSHFLMEITSLRLPRLAETLGKARGLGAGMVARGEYPLESALRLGGFLEVIGREREALAHALAVLAEVAPARHGALGEAPRAALKAADDFVAIARERVLGSQGGRIGPDEFFAAGTRAITAALSLDDVVMAELDALLADRVVAAQQRLWLEVAGGVLVILIGVYLFAAFRHSLTRAIGRIQETVAALADRDLTREARIDSRDEMQAIARDMNSMIVRLREVIADVVAASDELATAAGEGSRVAERSRRSIERQHEELEQVATAMNEMSATVQEVANNAGSTAEATRDAEAEAERGRVVVQETVAAIGELSQVLSSAGDVIRKLDSDASNIGQVLEVISGIAEQTNLLALNAAIEAARAGEQGRGFAVVADEVRTLASRTQSSTEEIRAMIERLQGNAREAVCVMEEGNSRSQATVERAGQASEALDAITAAVERITLMSQQIASAAEEQSCVAEEINRNLLNVKALAESTLEDASVTAQTSERLDALSERLQGDTRQFRV